jgi:phosphatidylinositol alpha-mannosyltransferase
MRVALVSPYSWTYPGGVTRHVEALADELIAAGHDVRVFAPFDHDSRLTRLAHRGARPQARPMPDHLVPIGGTVGWPANGAISNLALTPASVSALRRGLREFAPDVVHLQEPVAQAGCWDTLMSWDGPKVGTFHTYSTAAFPHGLVVMNGVRRRMNRLAVRIAVSEAAAWTGQRFYGGEYRVVPNGVALPAGGVPQPRARAGGEPLRIAFVGQAVERKGLPVLLRAFEGLRREMPAELTLIGADPAEVEPLLIEREGITVLGRVDDERKHAALAEADVLCAPSLGGESFGMVLTEAFAAGTPVVASDIAGYRDVVTHGEDGLLFPRGDAMALAETLRDLALDPGLAPRLGTAAARTAERYAWPHVAEQVAGIYEDAVGAHAKATVAMRLGLRQADGSAPVPARRLPSLEPQLPRAHRGLRRAGLAVAAVATVGGSALALDRIGIDPIVNAMLASSPTWVLLALALMCTSMAMRAVAWHAILKAALPAARPKLADALQGTFIGVLMSATLPARLGEPSRAYVVARRLGNARERLPVVLGTLVSQTLLNLLALLILGAVMFSTIGLFAGRQQALVWYALAPIVVLCLVLVAPALLRGDGRGRTKLLRQVRAAAHQVRSGLRVFRRPKLGATAAFAQLAAWAIQWMACYLLLIALGLEQRADLGAAAAVLFAVNVTAVLPVTPSNLGVFQVACVAVLTGAYGVSAADALGYGIILQAVEIATAFVMGAPALVREGVSWHEVRLRALHAAPVSLGRAAEDPA